MIETFSYGNRIISHSYVRIYLAGHLSRIWYPYRLEHAGYTRPTTRKRCLEYVIDSGWNNDDITNEEILDIALERNATWVVPKDYPDDRDRTIESIREFVELYEDHSCVAHPIVPLQPPYVESYEELCEIIGEEHLSHMALGGMAEANPTKQIEAIQAFRNHVGYGPYLHGLGMGTSKPAVKAIRDDPRLLDSLDLSSPIQDVTNGKVCSKYQERVDCEMPKGTDSTIITAAAVSWQILQLNYVMGPLCNDDELEEALSEVSFQATIADTV